MARPPATTVIRQEIVIIASALAWCGARERKAAGGRARAEPRLAGDPADQGTGGFPRECGPIFP